jgi:tetratricopeptide (TPR) repeat protein
MHQGDVEACGPLSQKGLDLARQAGDKMLVAWGWNGIGCAAALRGQFGLAQEQFEESLVLYRELGNRRQVAILLSNLGMVAREQGDLERARTVLEESLRNHRELGDRPITKYALVLLGTISMLQGDFVAARAYHQESLDVSREMGDQSHVAASLYCLATVARYQGDLETARTRGAEALRLQHELGNRKEMLCLVGLGCVAVMAGERKEQAEEAALHWFARGARLFGAAEARQEERSQVIWSEERLEYERCLAAAREALGAEAFATAWEEGRAMSLDAAVAYALGAGDAS